MAGSLDDNPPRLFATPEYEYEYLVLADTKARIYVSRDGRMTRREISAQLRRLADYIDSLEDGQARR